MKLSQFSFEFDEGVPGKKVEEEKKMKRGRKKLNDPSASLAVINVPDDEILFQKQYYPIGDVAEMFQENTSLIRYWDNEFSILKPKKK